MTNVEDRTGDLLSQGEDALTRGAWSEARDAFAAALGVEESARAHEGLSMVARWVVDEASVFEHAAVAFRLYREAGDAPSAARVAMYIADDCVAFRGEPAVANGWLRLARRLLEGVPLTQEHGWMEFYDGFYALMERNDTLVAAEFARKGLQIGRELGDLSLEALGLALEGLAVVTAGEVEEGMRLLDQATASVLAGDVGRLDWSGSACCFLLDACCRVRDYDRAAQWVPRIRDLFLSHGMEIFLSQCRPNYAQVLVWRGAWEEAERELISGVEEMLASRPPFAAEALVRLGELRIRQGRYDDARAELERAAGDPLSQLGYARLALEEGDAETAIDFCQRYLRRIPSSARADRATGLEVVVPALIASGDLPGAAANAEELFNLARQIGTGPFLGSAAVARGLVAEARGDLAAARRDFEDACDTLTESGGLYEAARARRQLATVLAQLGRYEAAIAEAGDAERYLRLVGAIAEANKARELLSGLVGALPAALTGAAADGLTPRECEVLVLVARGLSNHQIADVLVLSVRTVERHISNIYLKIGANGPAARAIAVAHATSRIHHT